ncbi:MAG TPA: hypothetical protein VGS41_18270 [Chthonomonadales bacterium]|nr:hypothetical protein [Chthonomonadales bacterium]
MSIPERLYRIARFKLTELKDRLDRMDEEAAAGKELEARRREMRAEASRELDELGPTLPAAPVSPPTYSSRLRTPEEIASGVGRSSAPSVPATQAQPVDPVTYHYRLLGVDPGSDFATVQASYHRLAARCDSSRFPEGSPEANDARQIRERLEASYQVLRDALDPRSRRFDLLEFDAPSPAQPSGASPGAGQPGP